MFLRTLPLLFFVLWTSNFVHAQCNELQLNVTYDNSSTLEECCWNVSFVNDGLVETVAGLEVHNLQGAQIGSLTANGSWTTQNVSATSGQVFPNTPFILPGAYQNQFTSLPV